jgi:hypothetical protein
MVHCARYALFCNTPNRDSHPHTFQSHLDFITEHPEYVARNNAMDFLSDNGGANYNLCHCTSFPPFPGSSSKERSGLLTIVTVGARP